MPNEACGLIAGTSEQINHSTHNDRVCKTAHEVYCLQNMEASPIRFSFSPSALTEAISDIASKGYVLLGNFHSHPSTSARPSDEDVQKASAWPEENFSHVIVSLENGRPSIKSWTIDRSGRYTQEFILPAMLLRGRVLRREKRD